MAPQRAAAAQRYQLGLVSVFRSMFEGIWKAIYSTRRMEMHVWYCTSVRRRPSSNPFKRALVKFLRSMKLRIKRMMRTGKARRSIFQRRARSSAVVQVNALPGWFFF
jgi:hypothetical protein